MTGQDVTKVRDVMTPSPSTIDGLANVAEAIELMRRLQVSSLIIDRQHENDEYGILVVHDIAEKLITQNRSPDRVSVYEIMSKPVITVDVGMDIKYAIRLLTRFEISRTLVTKNGQLAGIITLRDMVLHYLDSKPNAD